MGNRLHPWRIGSSATPSLDAKVTTAAVTLARIFRVSAGIIFQTSSRSMMPTVTLPLATT